MFSSLIPYVLAGYHVLTFAAKTATCAVHGDGTTDYRIPAYGQCNSWANAASAPALMLSVFVNNDCSVTISPIGDKTCSDPGANDGQTPLLPFTDGFYGVDQGVYEYTYNDLLMHGYYASLTSIRSLLPADEAGSRCAPALCLVCCVYGFTALPPALHASLLWTLGSLH